MNLNGLKIGFALTGSFCTIDKIIPQLIKLVIEEKTEVFPILSYSFINFNTHYGSGLDWKVKIENITSKNAISTIIDAEPIGPENFLDIVIVAPCTGNTLSKLANGISDTPVLMAVKAQLRNSKPVVLGISTNDALGMSAKNLGVLLNTKNVYFVPFGQDSPFDKPNSLVAHFELIPEVVSEAIKGKQYQPLIKEFRN